MSMESDVTSLWAWAQHWGVTYSVAREWALAGKLEGMLRQGRYTRLPLATSPPKADKIACALCGKEFLRITATHLAKSHGMTTTEYQETFPASGFLTDAEAEAIGLRTKGLKTSEETCMRISAGRKGVVPKNHPRYVVGVHHASDATKAKMSIAQTGRVHSEETKKKIGEGNTGKIMSPESIAQGNAGRRAFYEQHGSPLKGRKMSVEYRQLMSEAALRREAAYTPERRAEVIEAAAAGRRGLKRSAEARERYRAATLKRMQENPSPKTANTRGEQAVAAWLDAHGIAYRRQIIIDGLQHAFDFYVEQFKTLIEFDGAHHWLHVWWNVVGKTPAERHAMLDRQRERDAVRNLSIGHLGYRIVRICAKAIPGDSEHGNMDEQMAIQEFPPWGK